VINLVKAIYKLGLVPEHIGNKVTWCYKTKLCTSSDQFSRFSGKKLGVSCVYTFWHFYLGWASANTVLSF